MFECSNKIKSKQATILSTKLCNIIFLLAKQDFAEGEYGMASICFCKVISSLKSVYNHFVLSNLKCGMRSIFIVCKKFNILSRTYLSKFLSIF